MTSAINTQSGEKLPPIQDIHMSITKDGTWYHQGGAIKRMALVKLFATILQRKDDGSYWLITPVERGEIMVEDAPFVAVELQNEGTGTEQVIRLRSNIDQWVTLGPDNSLRLETSADGQPAPYVHMGKGLEARLIRSVFYHLVDLAVSETRGDKTELGVWSMGTFFPLMNEGAMS